MVSSRLNLRDRDLINFEQSRSTSTLNNLAYQTQRPILRLRRFDAMENGIYSHLTNTTSIIGGSFYFLLIIFALVAFHDTTPDNNGAASEIRL